MQHPGEGQRNDDSFIDCHQQQTEELVVHPVDIFIVIVVVVKLRMIIGLHKASAGKIIYHGRNAGDGDGKVIGPGLDGRGDLRLLRVGRSQRGQIFQKTLQKRKVFPCASDPRPRPVGKCGQFKVQVGDHLSAPVGMDGEDLLVGAGRPVELGIDHAPFLGCHGAEGEGILRLIADL